MKGHHYDFRQLKNHTTSPVPRARGGRTEMQPTAKKLTPA